MRRDYELVDNSAITAGSAAGGTQHDRFIG